ncbi:MAG TPA: aldo/keto reductase [Deinococcales bacterium]|nr:aldo/keto reductase [Deinococcales bacterium]
MSDIPTIELNNGVKMPQLGLGVFLVPPEETERTVLAAFEAGYRLIDTATAYRNEAGVGAALKASGLKREEVFVTSKLWNADHGFEKALKGFDASLDRLGLDVLDLYLIHWPLPMKGLAGETWRALEQVYRSGRVRAIGVSNFNPEHLEPLLAAGGVVPAVNQVELHPAFNQPALRAYCERHGIRVESWYPLGGQKSKDSLLSRPLLQDLARKYGKTPAQVVLRWHTQLGLIVIPKSTHAERIRENRAIFDFKLDDADVSAITALDTGVRAGSDPATANF